jgi:fanconi-associated nuclease 1
MASRFHCEGRILRALYAVLFWDVIFAEVDGAFETGFQSAPLDIADESFYYTRKELIDERLKALKENPQEATRLVQSVYDRYSEKKPWCVGFRWDEWQKEDLLEIVEVSVR